MRSKKIDWKSIALAVGLFVSSSGMVISLHEISHEAEMMRIQNNANRIDNVQKLIDVVEKRANTLEIQVAKLETRLRM